jgi:hypothetical protein
MHVLVADIVFPLDQALIAIAQLDDDRWVWTTPSMPAATLV